MQILPAVDLKGGKAVRLLKGDMDTAKIYGDRPEEMAKKWEDLGGDVLHVVDLDGAFDGESENEKHIIEIAANSPVPVEVGGGIRTLDKAARLIEGGVERVIIGTKALEDRKFLDELLQKFPGHVNVGVDAKDGMVAIKGWVEKSDMLAEDFLKELSGSGVGAIIYTDISRDGAMVGPNIESLRRATEITDIPIIASGGVSCLEDVQKLSKLPLFGIISGKALYDGRLSLKEAIAAVKNI